MYNVKIDQFYGPFDLIIELISKKKLDICDISIIDIINDFVDYIKNNNLESEEQGEFLLVASRLLEIKSKFLLSVTLDEDDEDSIVRLVTALEIYKKCKSLAEIIKTRENFHGDFHTRKPSEQFINETFSLDNLTLNLFIKNIDILKKNDNTKLIEIKNKKIVSVEDKITIIQKLLKNKNKLLFSELIKDEGKDDSVAALLSILELAKIDEIGILQYDLFNEIIIEGKLL